jgi:hypothetical protein
MQAFNQDLAINPIFKCDECSYMAISQTVMKHCSKIKHPNKEEPEALGTCFGRFSSAFQFS